VSTGDARYPPKRLIRGTIRAAQRSIQHLAIPHSVRRRYLEAAARLSRLPKGTRVTEEELGGVRGRRFEAGEADGDRAILYLHGGSFCSGSSVTHRGLTAHLASESEVPVHSLDYRLAPEHPYPQALDDAEAAYRALLEAGIEPRRLVVAGDSAGGWLALALAVRLRDRGPAHSRGAIDRPSAGLSDQADPLPAGLALMCPFLDMTLSGETLEANRRRDIGLRSDWLRRTRPLFFADPSLDPVELTAARGDLRGLPPIHLQAAADDVLRSDAELLRDRAREAGVELEYRCWDGVWHDFHAAAGALREADEALAELGRYVREVTA
jgi:acetyl esterase/lipase